MSNLAVLFDLDGTLLDRDSSLLLFAQDQYDRFPELRIAERDVFIRRFIELDQHGYVWKDKVYQQLLVELSISALEWPVMLDDYLRHFPGHCVAFPGLSETLSRLKQQGARLALVSNGFGQFQYDNLKALGVEHLFDAILISEWEAVRKPDPAIFHRALDKLGVSAENAWFIGDHPDNDIRAARAAGLKTVWKRSGQFEAPPEADAVIGDLTELLEVILPADL